MRRLPIDSANVQVSSHHPAADVLATVAQEAWLSRARAISWQDPLRVAVYPINGDGSEAAADYLRGLKADPSQAIEHFFDEEGKRHGRASTMPSR